MGILDTPAYSRNQADAKFAPRASYKSVGLFQGAQQVTTRSGSIGTSGLSPGTVQSETSEVKHVALGAIPDVRLVYANTYDLAPGPNPITVKASVRLPSGILLPVFFRGSRSAVVEPGAFLISDPVSIPPTVVAGTVLRSRTYVSVGTIGQKWPLLHRASASGEGVTASADQTDAGSVTTGNGFVYAPIAMIGATAVPQPSVAIIGDSIARGEGDVVSALPEGCDLGFLPRGLYAASRAYINTARNGETTLGILGESKFSRVFPLVAGCTHAINEFGINDVRSGYTLAQIQANWLQEWTAVSDRQVKALQTTITPDSQPSGAAPNTTEAVRLTSNAWLRAGAPIDPTTKAAVAIGTSGALKAAVYDLTAAQVVAPSGTGHPLTAVIEVADAAETARNSGMWKSGYSTDWLHPNNAGHIALAAAIIPQLTAIINV